jgi:hypothetical protein
MYPASCDKLLDACKSCNFILGNDAAAIITVSLIAAAAGLALAGYGHCGEQFGL